MGDVRIREWGAPGDLGWVVMAHGELYAAEYGFDAGFERHVVRAVAEIAGPADRARQRGWIAELDGHRVGSVVCTPSDAGPEVAQLRLLLLHPDARGLGVGGRLVDTCVAFAAGAGYRRMRLWTTDVLTAARGLYASRGFREIARAPHDGFGVPVTGLDYELDLAVSLA
ncbi:GNAT family N-acetyltransferase [Pseudonocardia sp. CA-107938]|uniref:GNAT family N-acetyltransferase n=1 Tax=Pseudonocardia sp. CA-107938 TaxID=3240021 RepID=UPI003D91FADE